MPNKNDCPDNCFQGSTEFYDTPETDEFTPSDLEAGLLVDNVAARRSDHQFPPWITGGDPTKSPYEQYVEWFNGIWHTGDPSTWNETVFTNLAVMIDPSGVSKGAKQAAAGFLLLFKYFPELRGEVVSWAANDREIFINWRFQIIRKKNKTPLLVPVVDKFCFKDGRVSFRLANFDILTFIGYLSETYGLDQLIDFLSANSQQAEKTGGIQRLPSIIWNLFKGLFYWQPTVTPTGLTATPGDGIVSLAWNPIKGAISYKISRAANISGPYEPLPFSLDVQGTRFDDKTVTNGTSYWYLISPNFEKWRPVPVINNAPMSNSPARLEELANAGYTLG